MNKTSTLLLLIAVLFGEASFCQAAPIPTGAIYTSKTRFRIPFRYDPAEMQAIGAREVRLYVSRDRGASWRPGPSVAPSTGKFQFEANGDGEYWFIVRTVDSRNRLHPDGEFREPGLQVIVDSTAPQIQLALRQPSPGRVQLSWNAIDSNIDTTQFRILCLQPGNPDWQPLSVVPQSNGQTSWSIPRGGIVAVRASIADLAKNVGHSQAQLKVEAVDQKVPRPTVPDFRQPIASPGSTAGQNLAMSDQFPTAPIKQYQVPTASIGSGAAAQSANSPLPGTTAAVSPPAGADSNFVSYRPDSQLNSSGNPQTPPDQKVKIVNVRRFQIGYKLHDVDPAKIQGIDLYITPDQGATWYRYGEDANRQSPVQVSVPRPGTYGFALGVRSTVRTGYEPPRQGDKPAIVVVVDQTPPQLHMLPLEQGRQGNQTKLLIRWRYADAAPASRPILVSYADNPQGPWQPVGEWQENSGSCVWSVGPDVPSRIYLRLEARDAAGNVQVVYAPHVLQVGAQAAARVTESPTAPAGPFPQK